MVHRGLVEWKTCLSKFHTTSHSMVLCLMEDYTWCLEWLDCLLARHAQRRRDRSTVTADNQSNQADRARLAPSQLCAARKPSVPEQGVTGTYGRSCDVAALVMHPRQHVLARPSTMADGEQHELSLLSSLATPARTMLDSDDEETTPTPTSRLHRRTLLKLDTLLLPFLALLFLFNSLDKSNVAFPIHMIATNPPTDNH